MSITTDILNTDNLAQFKPEPKTNYIYSPTIDAYDTNPTDTDEIKNQRKSYIEKYVRDNNLTQLNDSYLISYTYYYSPQSKTVYKIRNYPHHDNVQPYFEKVIQENELTDILTLNKLYTNTNDVAVPVLDEKFFLENQYKYNPNILVMEQKESYYQKKYTEHKLRADEFIKNYIAHNNLRELKNNYFGMGTYYLNPQTNKIYKVEPLYTSNNIFRDTDEINEAAFFKEVSNKCELGLTYTGELDHLYGLNGIPKETEEKIKEKRAQHIEKYASDNNLTKLKKNNSLLFDKDSVIDYYLNTHAKTMYSVETGSKNDIKPNFTVVTRISELQEILKLNALSETDVDVNIKLIEALNNLSTPFVPSTIDTNPKIIKKNSGSAYFQERNIFIKKFMKDNNVRNLQFPTFFGRMPYLLNPHTNQIYDGIIAASEIDESIPINETTCFKEITNDIKPSNSSYKGRLDELYALNGINKTTTANDIA